MATPVRWYWDFGALLAGIAFTLAFSPFDVYFFSFIALAFLFWSILHLPPGRAFVRGYLFGLGQFGLGVSWVFVSMYQFGGAHWSIASLMTLFFVGFWALFPALASGLSALMPVRRTSIRVLMFALIWMLVEYLRGQWILNGFPWLQLAYSQLDTPLAGFIPLTGAYGTGLLAALTASALVLSTLNKRMGVGAILFFGIVWGSGSMLKKRSWTYDVGPPLQVSLIQGNIAQDQKWRPEFRQTTLERYRRMTEQQWHSDVIVWPETAVPAYLEDVYGDFIVPLDRAAQKHGSDLIVSVPAHGRSPDEKFNAVITLGKDQGMYRKVHLLPFGEYMPWQPLSGAILQNLKIRLGNFTPGATDQPLLKAGSYPFVTLICYEDAISERARQGLPDGAYLVNVTNDGWFGDSIEPYQHMQLARMRALETGRFLLRATNTGLTGIVAPDGRIVRQSPLFTVSVLTGSITPRGGMTPYAESGDGPVLGVLITLALLLAALDWSLRKE